MSMITKKLQLLSPLLALVLLIPGVIDDSMAQETLGGEDTPYALEDINHSFNVMEEYVIYDENKNITFDISNALEDEHVSQYDIQIALDYVTHNNDIMNAVTDHVGKVNELEVDDGAVKRALEELEEGKFRMLFGNDEASVVNEISFVTYDVTHIPISSIFGVSEYNLQNVRHSPNNSNLACGGNYQTPHPRPSHTTTGYFSNEISAVYDLLSNGYHLVALYASYNYPDDYAKIVNAYGCDNGPFRTQSIVIESGNYYRHSNNDVEPNSEVLSYVWPKLWWGPYVYWWHDNF